MLFVITYPICIFSRIPSLANDRSSDLFPCAAALAPCAKSIPFFVLQCLITFTCSFVLTLTAHVPTCKLHPRVFTLHACIKYLMGLHLTSQLFSTRLALTSCCMHAQSISLFFFSTTHTFNSLFLQFPFDNSLFLQFPLCCYFVQ